MRLQLSILLLACCGAVAHAAPPPQSQDDIGRFMVEQGLIGAGIVAQRTSELVLTAMGFLGVPYRRGGTTYEGFDCSGFVRAMYEQTLGFMLPRRANEQAAATSTIQTTELQPGDLVFFNTMKSAFSHVGIYVGNNKFIHSPKPGAEVRVEDMGKSYWSSRFDGARRVVASTP